MATPPSDKTAEAARRGAELDAIVQALPLGVYFADEAGGLRCNDEALRTFGVTSVAELGRDPDEFLRLFRHRHLATGAPVRTEELPMVRALRGEPATLDLWLTRRDGAEVMVRVRAAPVRMDGRIIGAVGVSSDLTDQHALQQALRAAADEARGRATELEQSRRALRLLASVTELVARATSEVDLLADICRLAVEREGFRMAWIGRAEPDGARRIVPVAHAGHEAGYLGALELTWADVPGGQGPAGVAVRTGRPVVVNDVAADPLFAPWREPALSRRYGAALALPLSAGGARVGVLGLLAEQPGAFDADALRVLSRMADDVAAGIEALRRREEAAKLATHLEISADLAGLGLWRLDLITGRAVASPRARELAGFAPGEPADRAEDWVGRVHEADRQAVAWRLQAAMAGSPAAVAGAWSFRFRHPGGAVRWIEGRVTLEREGPRPAVLLGAVLDVTDRVVERERLQALSDRLQAAREEEQARVARDLHDDLGQSLTGLQLDLQAIQEALEALPPSPAIGAALDRAVQAAETARGTAAAVQRIALELRPVALDRLGLAAALRQELRRFEQRTGLACRGELAEVPGLEPAAAIALYRIGQEALTNVARHAQARAVVVRLGGEAGEVVLEVEDDGLGLPAGAAEDPAALGLLSMRERARAAGGTVRLGPGTSAGTRVTARLPARAAGGAA